MGISCVATDSVWEKRASWSLFLRYQAQAERHYRRAVEEFERLKALRGELPDDLPNETLMAGFGRHPRK